MKQVFALTIIALLSTPIRAQVSPVFDFLREYPNARDFTMTTDGREAYFTLQNLHENIAILACTERKGDGWLPPTMVSFTGTVREWDEPDLFDTVYFVIR